MADASVRVCWWDENDKFRFADVRTPRVPCVGERFYDYETRLNMLVTDVSFVYAFGLGGDPTSVVVNVVPSSVPTPEEQVSAFLGGRP